MNCTPENWSQTKVIFLAKAGKSDYSQPRAYRPISLMSCFMKAMERVVLWQLQETALKENPINVNQHAFQKGRSTESALTIMTEYVEEAFVKNQWALATSLDIKGAFDHLTIEGVEKGLKKKQVHPTIINWCIHFLRHRRH